MALPCCGADGQELRFEFPKESTVGTGDLFYSETDCVCGVHWTASFHVLHIEDLIALVYVSGVTGIKGTPSYLKIGRLARLHLSPDGILRESR
jgi:hypothetical protein